MRTEAPTKNFKQCGLRFERSEAANLRALADRVKADDLRSDVSVFESAAESAERSEPLVVHFSQIEEVVEMVAHYVRLGIKQPVIEELSR